MKEIINDLLSPITIGNVFNENFLSPSISSISFNISLGRWRKNANKNGKIEGLILPDVIEPRMNVKPEIPETNMFPKKRKGLKKGV